MNTTDNARHSPGVPPSDVRTHLTDVARLTLGYDCVPVQVRKSTHGGWRVVTKELTVVPSGKTGFLDTADGNRAEVLVVFGEILADGGVELCLKRIGEIRRRAAPPPYFLSKSWAATSLIVGLAVGMQLPLAKWLAPLIK